MRDDYKVLGVEANSIGWKELDMAKMRLKSVSPLTVAAWHGLYSLIFALMLGIVYSAYTLYVYGQLPPSRFAYYMIAIPVIYCPLGFIAYGLVALIYNSIAKHRGGITLELDNADDDAPPPPPTF
jgi:hypothetical protein